MLPDFPALKKEILERLAARTRAGAQAGGLMALMPPFIIHEGNRSRIVRRDDTTQEISFDNPIRAKVAMSFEEMAEGPAAALAALDQMTQSLQEGMAHRTYQAIEDAAKSVGNLIDAQDRQWGPELYFEGLQKIELSFDSDGTWIPPTYVAHPDTLPKIQRVLDTIEDDPKLRARRDAIVEQQRGEWRVREASRRLVD